MFSMKVFILIGGLLLTSNSYAGNFRNFTCWDQKKRQIFEVTLKPLLLDDQRAIVCFSLHDCHLLERGEFTFSTTKPLDSEIFEPKTVVIADLVKNLKGYCASAYAVLVPRDLQD